MFFVGARGKKRLRRIIYQWPYRQLGLDLGQVPDLRRARRKQSRTFLMQKHSLLHSPYSCGFADPTVPPRQPKTRHVSPAARI